MHATQRQEYVEFVEAATPRLRRTAYLLTGDRHRADDVVQQTLTRLYVKWGRARGADDVGAYVHRMLVNAFRQERRSRWFGVQLFERAPEPGFRVGSSGPDESVVDAVAVRAALAAVPPGQRVVLVLRFYADLSVEQTAEVLGCSTGNVKSQTARGLAALRRRLPLGDGTEVNR
ncbi:RNA polymerase sigma-70 factor, sigma-E family [Micromonospora purpureochromogenes]|uniref:RNA polymerase sigma-70 factor, sigma-E family n=1 Tax=Micromonospora purpureochromogenes TaxID=47872 RepID=A0A1C4ZUK9_9ACTN|nr:SigE family RNA polymerase sigma factor [Micromonospora purpureochromogenes]SCF36623.1 RNA polymerase sigma-70 factor, sigma-E family [Micromonospora purpureochromogenes]